MKLRYEQILKKIIIWVILFNRLLHRVGNFLREMLRVSNILRRYEYQNDVKFIHWRESKQLIIKNCYGYQWINFTLYWYPYLGKTLGIPDVSHFLQNSRTQHEPNAVLESYNLA